MNRNAIVILVVLALACTVHLANSSTLHVWQDSPSPTPPHSDWASAAHVIQDAVDAAVDGDTVLVTNGVYATGGRAVVGIMTNRVAIDRAITLLSVNGPEVTVIEGAEAPESIYKGNGEGAIRCVCVGAGATLSGFTLRNGHTRIEGDATTQCSGGGIWCEAESVVTNCVLTANCAGIGSGGGAFGGTLFTCTLTHNYASEGGGASDSLLYNCTLTSNEAPNEGGGTSRSTLYNCTLTENSAELGGGAYRSELHNCILTDNIADFGGGAYRGTLYNCLLSDNFCWNIGGGAYDSALYNCTVTGNSARNDGGGAESCTLFKCIITENMAESQGGGTSGSTLYNCTLRSNSASHAGGGAIHSDLFNCTLTGHSARWGAGAYDSTLYNCTLIGNEASMQGGGAYDSGLYNCIAYHNSAPELPNHGYSTLFHSCTAPFPAGGFGNIDAEPAFLNAAAGDFRLAPDSPCIDAGSDFDLGDGTYLSDLISSDLDGNPRPLDGDGDGVAQFDMGAYEFLRELSPREAIQELILAVEESSLKNRRKHPLQVSLLAALSSVERDQVKAAVNQLEAFQNKVRAQVTRIDSQLAEDLIGAAQEIIDALTPPEPEPGPIPNMVWLEPGMFIMGSPESEPMRMDREGPQTEVTITRGFWMGKYEVAQGEYLDVVGSNPSYFRNGTNAFGSGGPVINELQHPVEQLSWRDATNYCRLLTERERSAGRLPEGYVYRLPTEAEWEYACRAGTTTAFAYGPALRSGMANFDGTIEYDASVGTIINPEGIFLGRTIEVGSFRPNAWGLYDMHGNVWEWCQDWWADSLSGGSVPDPTGPMTGSDRVIRGGLWFIDASSCRSAFRIGTDPEWRFYDLGFRVVLGHPYPLE